MISEYSGWQYWILQNLELLSKKYGKEGAVLNAQTWQSILIFYYSLPNTWRQKTSRLLIILPAQSKVFYTPPDRFYLDKGLKTNSGNKPTHYYESHGFNDMDNNGLARFSFHLKKGWEPKLPCEQGTTLLDVLEAFQLALNSAAKEAMS